MQKNFISGSAFNENKFKGNRIKSSLENRTVTKYVSLTEWCKNNFISKRVGRRLLAKKLLIGIRFRGQWWVCANLDCLPQLLDELNLENLYFDAPN